MQIAPINHIAIRNGVPIIAGTGLKVAIIANMYVHGHASVEWMTENYDLTPSQLYAAVSYYYDHAEEIDRQLKEADELAQKIGVPADQLQERIRKRQADNNGTP